MSSKLMIATMLCLTLSTSSQSSRIETYSISMIDGLSAPVTHGDYRTEVFEAGGNYSPAIKADIEFEFTLTSDIKLLEQSSIEAKLRPAILVKVSLIDVDRDQIVSSVIVELNRTSPVCRSFLFPIGDRASRYQIWFEDSWEESVNGTRRAMGGTFVTWSGITVSLSPIVSELDDVVRTKPTRRGFKVD